MARGVQGDPRGVSRATHSPPVHQGLPRPPPLTLLLTPPRSAPDDLPAPDAARLLLKDIREARQAKVRAGLRALNPIHLGMPNLSRLEIHALAPFFGQAFGRMVALDPQVDRHAQIEELWLEKPEEALRRSEAGEFGFEGASQDEGGVY